MKRTVNIPARNPFILNNQAYRKLSMEAQILRRDVKSSVNQKVKKENKVISIEDWGFIKSGEAPDAEKNSCDTIEKQLNGKIIKLKGNHDRNNKVKSIIHNMAIYYGVYDMFLTHKPVHCNPKYKINLCGHVHEDPGVTMFHDSVIVNCSMGKTTEGALIKIYDKIDIKNNDYIKTYNLSKGIYSLKIITNQGETSKKIIIN